MADLRYRAVVDVAQAQQNLSRLENSVDDLNRTFGDLRNAIAGIAIGAFITNSLNAATALDSLARATGIATDTLAGFQQAVSLAGGNAGGANDAISDLVKNIGEAANGSQDLISAFSQVGVSFQDLDRSSPEQILRKVVDGLSGIDDTAKRSAIAMKLMGEAVKTVDFRSVSGNIGNFSASNFQFAESARAAREAQEKMTYALTQLQISVVEALRPINELIAAINPDAIRRFTQALVAMAATLASIFVVGRIIQGIRLAATVMGSFGSAIRSVYDTLKMLITANWSVVWSSTSQLGSTFARIRIIIGAVVETIKDLLAPAFIILKQAFVPVMTLLAGYWASIQENTTAALNALIKYLNYLPFVNINPIGGGGPPSSQDPRARGLNRASEETAAEFTGRAAEFLKQQAKNAALLKEETLQYGQSLLINLSRQTEALNIERKLVGMTEDQAEIFRAQQENNAARLAAVRELDVEIRKLNIQSQFANETEKKQIADQIAALQARKKVTEDSFRIQNDLLAQYITELQTARLLEQDRLQTMENIKKSIEDQIARQQQLADIIQGINNQRRDLEFGESQRARGSVERQLAQIKENARKAALEAGRAYAAAFEDSGDGLSAERAQELADGLQQIADGYAMIAAQQENNLIAARDWNEGWREAFKQYADDANNAAKQAKTYFDTFARGFEDLFVSLLTRTKFSFKDFATSIIAEFARIQAQKMFVSLFGTGGFFGSLFGKANGGPTEAMKPIIVGERGPELFIPKMAGNIISNQNLRQTEAQPQITNVNYNINAVDAPSFRSLVARDPQFIYNVTEVGRRASPSRRLA